MSSWKWFRRPRSIRAYLKSNMLYIAALLVLFYVWSWVRNPYQPPTCTTMSEDTYQKDMHRFTHKIHTILDRLNIKHFLCYNALWGQIRYRRMFHWQSQIEICVVRKDANHFNGLEEVFQDEDIDIIYKSRKAEFLLNTEHIRGQVNLILFQLDEDSSSYYRPGWQYSVVPADVFPANLINSKELPLKPFGGYQLPVPLHDVEIQKYHFPDTWWKAEDPVFC